MVLALTWLSFQAMGPSILVLADDYEEGDDDDGEVVGYGAVEIGMLILERLANMTNYVNFTDIFRNFTERKHVHFLYENGANCKHENNYGLALEYFHIDCGSSGVCSLEKNFTIRARCKF